MRRVTRDAEIASCSVLSEHVYMLGGIGFQLNSIQSPSLRMEPSTYNVLTEGTA